MKKTTLNNLLLLCFVVWVGSFYFVHGSVVFSYLLLHLATSGIFTLLMLKKMK